MYVIATSFQSFSLHLTLGMDGSQGTGSYPLPPHGWQNSTKALVSSLCIEIPKAQPSLCCKDSKES